MENFTALFGEISVMKSFIERKTYVLRERQKRGHYLERKQVILREIIKNVYFSREKQYILKRILI